MSYLYWSYSHNVEDEVLNLLAENAREANVLGSSNGMPIISVSDPDSDALRLTVDLLAKKQIVGAALLSRPRFEDNFWLASGWWGRLVVERAEVSRVESVLNRLQHDGEDFERNLMIFRIHEKVSPPSEESAALVQDDPYKYYGNLADPSMGGANALYAAGFEAAQARKLSDDRIVVAPPEVLGFKLDTGKNSVVALRKKHTIAVEAVGFNRDSITEVADLFAKHRIDFDCSGVKRKFDIWRKSGLDFAVGLVIRGLTDPPVVIPVGSVYQQPFISSQKQNLAIAQKTSSIVAAGATVPLILPAWCLNEKFSPPNGPVVPTLLISVAAGGTQEEVWEKIKDRYQRLQ